MSRSLKHLTLYGLFPIACLAWLFPSINFSGPASLLSALVFLIYQLIAVGYGNQLVKIACQDNQPGDFVLAFVFGNLVVGALLVILRFWIDLSPFLGILVLAVPLLLCCLKSGNLLWTKFQPSDMDVFAMFMSLSMIFLFYPEALAPLEFNDEYVIVKPWSDSLIHSGTIQMLSKETIAFGYYTMQGMEHIYYHYGFYMLAALMSQVGGVPAFDAVGSIIIPVGISLLFCGIYLIAGRIWGARTGIVVASLFFLLPDATVQLFEHKWLGTHWLMNASPGMYFGLSAIILACFFVITYRESMDNKYIFFVCSAALILPFYRAQFSIIGCTAIALATASYIRVNRPFIKPVIIASIVVGAMITVWVLGKFLFKPFFVPPSPPGWLIEMVIRAELNDWYNIVIQWPGSIVVLTIVLLLSISGYYLMLIAAGAGYYIVQRKKLNKQHHYTIPMLIIALFSVNSWLLPQSAFGAIDEFTHRPLVMVYCIVFIWGIGTLFYYIDKLVSKNHPMTGIAITLSIGLFASIFLPSKEIDFMANSKHPKPLYDLSRKIAESDSKGKYRVLDSSYDPVSFVVSFSEHPSYLSRYEELKNRSNFSTRREARAEKMEALKKDAESIYAAQSYEQAKALAAEYGIRWLIKRPEHQLNWQSAKARVTTMSNYELYDFHL